MSYLQVEITDQIATVTLNRPEKHNAFHLPFLDEIQDTMAGLAENTAVRLVILTGAGEKSFSSGVDLNALVHFKSIAEARTFALSLEKANTALLRFPKPVIAAINGYAFGGGYGLASSTDVRLLARGAKIGFPAVRLGAILPIGCTLRLNVLIGAGRSRELLLSGRVIDDREALHIGLVNEIVPWENLLSRSREIADEILKGSDLALEMTKKMTNQELLVKIEQYSLTAAENFAFLAFSDEWKTRILNFISGK